MNWLYCALAESAERGEDGLNVFSYLLKLQEAVMEAAMEAIMEAATVSFD